MVRGLYLRLSDLISVVKLRLAGEAGAHSFFFRHISEPVVEYPTIPVKPISFWQTAKQRSHARVIVYPSPDSNACIVEKDPGGDDKLARSGSAEADGLQLGALPAFRSTDLETFGIAAPTVAHWLDPLGP